MALVTSNSVSNMKSDSWSGQLYIHTKQVCKYIYIRNKCVYTYETSEQKRHFENCTSFLIKY